MKESMIELEKVYFTLDLKDDFVNIIIYDTGKEPNVGEFYYCDEKIEIYHSESGIVFVAPNVYTYRRPYGETPHFIDWDIKRTEDYLIKHHNIKEDNIYDYKAPFWDKLLWGAKEGKAIKDRNTAYISKETTEFVFGRANYNIALIERGEE